MDKIFNIFEGFCSMVRNSKTDVLIQVIEGEIKKIKLTIIAIILLLKAFLPRQVVLKPHVISELYGQ